MYCNCVVYSAVIAWNTLEDLQNYSNCSRLYGISSLITGTAQSRKSFFFSKLQNPNPVRIRFLLRKPESGSCRTQPESGSKKSKIQSMHTSGDTKRREEIFLGKHFPISLTLRPFSPTIRVARIAVAFTTVVRMVFGSALTLATFVLVVVVAWWFNSWDHFTFFKSFRTLDLGVSVSLNYG